MHDLEYKKFIIELRCFFLNTANQIFVTVPIGTADNWQLTILRIHMKKPLYNTHFLALK